MKNLSNALRKDFDAELIDFETIPSAPPFLSPNAQVLWRKFAPQYAHDESALHTLRIALEAKDRGQKARAMTNREGLVFVEHDQGTISMHPAIRIERENVELASKLFMLLGINPEELNCVDHF